MIDDVKMVVPTITADETLCRISDAVQNGAPHIGISGLWGSSAPMVASALYQRLKRPLLYITAHLDETDETRDDLETFLGEPVDILPPFDTLPWKGASAGEIHDERLRFCAKLRDGGSGGRKPSVIVTPIQALLQPVPNVATIDANTLRLATGEIRDPEKIVEWLVDRGFERLDRVESPGDFARRGDILDIYSPDRDDPLRIEFLDDSVEAIRVFDVSSQRSIRSMPDFAITALPHRHHFESGEITSFIDFLPNDTVLTLDRPGDVQEMAETFWKRLNKSPALYEPRDVLKRFVDFQQLHITRIGAAIGAREHVFHFRVQSLSRFEGKIDRAIAELCGVARDHTVVVYCARDGERERLIELIEQESGSVPASIHIEKGLIHRGFEWSPTQTIVVGHHEIFQRRPSRRLRRSYAALPIESVLDLIPGDVIVHVVHGIARFTGMKTMRKDGSGKTEEYLTLEFADNAVLHVTTTQINLIQKYIGAGGVKPTLSKLGGTRWKNTKEKVGDAVSELAESLLKIHAERDENEGTAYPADTPWQREFEAAFMYEDTEDQRLVATDIKTDLCRPRPMDRLVCGDVGYGKTELAIRAAFKVIEFGRQVAVLVPTTVLAEQHYRTFSERLADYPFSIGCLSRFRKVSEQKSIVENARKGRVDILIGTHRMLSKDVGFANLGLVIIDEEQRFGVEHKERLKQMRATVDVLSLSATPIPRTLHMSLVGLRDISSLQTPPLDRRAIASHVCHFSADTIREAIIRELSRDGQIYFIHNVVHNIETLAQRITQIVPEARILIGHGQMKEGQLEKVMRDFVNRKADILLATTIIESGIDIPTVNTIFINNADRFGLADLHQLRGRVGRSSHRGYCYFLLPNDRVVTPKAAKRLKAIEEFSDLGAGFRIAMRDLEIRGAGNLLGAEQSGHIAAVGYEMYCQLLDNAVRRMKGEPPRIPDPVHIELDVVAHIPKSYIPAERTRIDVYRRVSGCVTIGDLDALEKDLHDTFGQFPPPVERLLRLAEIRLLAAMWRVKSIIYHDPDIIFSVANLAAVQDLFADAPGSVRSPDPNTVHLRLPPKYLEAPTLLSVLRKLLQRGAQRKVAQ